MVGSRMELRAEPRAIESPHPHRAIATAVRHWRIQLSLNGAAEAGKSAQSRTTE